MRVNKIYFILIHYIEQTDNKLRKQKEETKNAPWDERWVEEYWYLDLEHQI